MSLPLGVVAQAVLGGFTVREHLAPGFVMAHFSLSMLILIAAVALAWRSTYEPGARPRSNDRVAVWSVRALAPLGALTISSAPARRPPARMRAACPGSASTGCISRATTRYVDGPPPRDDRGAVRDRGHRRVAAAPPPRRAQDALEPLTVLGVLLAAQGLVGSVQYELRLPTDMVWVHVTLATLSWLAVLWSVAEAAPGAADSARRRESAASVGAAEPALAPAELAITSARRRRIGLARYDRGCSMSFERTVPASPPNGARNADASLSILVVDDESDLREMLTRSFSREGHRVMAVADGRAAIDRASTDHFDIVLLDVALGAGPDGYEVCRTLRGRRNVVPIIMLTALDSEADAVLGLEAGADDYVTKPFGLAELRSRIRAVLRRAGTRAMGDELLVVGPITLDRAQREVTVAGEPVRLTFSEFELLDALMADPGRLLNRQELLRAIWGDSAYRDPRAIDVHIRHLREKLEPEPDKPRYILTVRGAGYRLRGP